MRTSSGISPNQRQAREGLLCFHFVGSHRPVAMLTQSFDHI